MCVRVGKNVAVIRDKLLMTLSRVTVIDLTSAYEYVTIQLKWNNLYINDDNDDGSDGGCGKKPRFKYTKNTVTSHLFILFVWYTLLLGLCCAVSQRRVRITVIAPEKAQQDEEVLGAILPAVTLAIKAVAKLLPNHTIEHQYRNSNCSVTYGPLAAIELRNISDVFLGPVCDYVIAPVARYSGVWGIPVMTSSAQVDVFSFKPDYPTLTRMMGTFRVVAEALQCILDEFNWNVAGILFFNRGQDSPLGHSKCYFTMSAVFKILGQKTFHQSFNESANSEEYKRLLQEVAKSARIVVLCAKASVLREILLAAEELNMIDSGEYVFFSIELYSSIDHSSLTPWYVKTDTSIRNERARKAYTALLIITARTPDNEEYKNFSVSVKNLVGENYTYHFGNETVSPHVSCFYDALLLYALALNESLETGATEINGKEITKRMWNRTFAGITGNVHIDENGDRIPDYSLLDLDPQTNKFKVRKPILSIYVRARKKAKRYT